MVLADGVIVRCSMTVMAVFPDFRPLTNADLPECTLRAHIKDISEEEYAKLDPKPAFWLGGPEGIEFSGDDAKEIFTHVCTTFAAPPTEEVPGQTFNELLAEAGGNVEILGLPEGENSASKK